MSELLTLPQMARELGVAKNWLRAHADSGHVPCLKAGKHRYLFNVDAVRDALAQQAAQPREVQP